MRSKEQEDMDGFHNLARACREWTTATVANDSAMVQFAESAWLMQDEDKRLKRCKYRTDVGCRLLTCAQKLGSSPT